jgi:hypothetical protein
MVRKGSSVRVRWRASFGPRPSGSDPARISLLKRSAIAAVDGTHSIGALGRLLNRVVCCLPVLVPAREAGIHHPYVDSQMTVLGGSASEALESRFKPDRIRAFVVPAR